VIELKTETELAAMRQAGRVVAQVLAAVRERAEVGMRLRELDELASEVIAKAGASPSFLGYHPSWAPTPYPGAICA
jgi:methionyl aminopeptidase